MSGQNTATPGDRRIIRLVRLALVLPVVFGLMMASSARAGELAQVTCTQPNGQPAPIEGWRGAGLGQYGVGSGPSDTCGEPGGALSALDSSAESEAAYNGPMWVYTAPAGFTIAGGHLTVSLTSPQGEAYVATPENVYAQADVLINCQFNLPCGPDGTETRDVPITHSGGTQLFAAALCVGPFYGATSCPPGSGGGVNAQIAIRSAEIELANIATPSASNFAGGLLQASAHGTEGVTFTAEDPDGPGVYRAIVEVDGATVYNDRPDTNSGRCARIGKDASGISEYLYAQPCKQRVAVNLPIDTTRLSDGEHRMNIVIEDAAGNSSVVYDGTISISNPGANASSVRLGAGAGGLGPLNGSNASEQARLTARWASNGKQRLTGRYGRSATIVGRLTTPSGTPISGAQIDLTAVPYYPAAPPVTMPSARTQPNGNFTATVPAGASSRALHLSYRSHLGGTPPAATSALNLSVPAALTLRAVPRTVKVGEKIVFRGLLHGSPIPHGGKRVVLEARSQGTRWIEFAVVATDARGHFKASHYVRLPGPETYQFRAVSEPEADFPFAAGASPVARVRER
jgi:hypothetical protein